VLVGDELKVRYELNIGYHVECLGKIGQTWDEQV